MHAYGAAFNSNRLCYISLSLCRVMPNERKAICAHDHDKLILHLCEKNSCRFQGIRNLFILSQKGVSDSRQVRKVCREIATGLNMRIMHKDWRSPNLCLCLHLRRCFLEERTAFVGNETARDKTISEIRTPDVSTQLLFLVVASIISPFLFSVRSASTCPVQPCG
jgi:hypothetical protein